MLLNLDPIYIWCLLILLVILILDRRDKKKFIKNFNNETFTSKIKNKYKSLFYPNNKNSINLNNKFKFTGGSNGIYPPITSCYSCGLYFNCYNYPYSNTSLKQNVCKKCKNIPIKFPENNFSVNKPIYVLGKSPGRPRVCRKL